MAKTCIYCDEEKSALKNHVRLASGDGHGPSGAYPDDFDPGGSSTANDDQLPATADDDRGGEQHDDETVDLTPEELDGMVKEVEEQAFEAGFSTAENNAAPVKVESSVEDADADSGQSTAVEPEPSSDTCPECGNALEYGHDPTKDGFVMNDGRTAWLADTDGLCKSCDLVVDATGETFYGSEYGQEAVDAGGGGVSGMVMIAVAGFVALVYGALTGGQNANDGPEVF